MLFFRDNKVLPTQGQGHARATGLLANICPTDSASAPLLRLVLPGVTGSEWSIPLSPCLCHCFSLSPLTPTHRVPLPMTLTKSSSDEEKTELGQLLCPFLFGDKRLFVRGGGSAIIVGT